MSQKHARLQIVSRSPGSSANQEGGGQHGHSETRKVSGRWLLSALALAIGVAALCVWCSLCLLFWQGSWELLYHPSVAITRTPASAGLPFETVQFAAGDTGIPRLSGWWIAAEPEAPYRHFTFLCLHDQKGNLSDTVDALARLHAIGVNVLAFDYRGYGQSQFVRPSEAHWREDANWALDYLTDTRHVSPGTIVLDGDGLGADLVLETAAAHPELAGVILQSPTEAPMNATFTDPRAKLIPAHLLTRDRYDVTRAAQAVRIPVLWFEQETATRPPEQGKQPEAYAKVDARKMLVWLGPRGDDKQFENALSRWLDELPGR